MFLPDYFNGVKMDCKKNNERRNFLKTTTLALGGIALSRCSSLPPAVDISTQTEEGVVTLNLKSDDGKPLRDIGGTQFVTSPLNPLFDLIIHRNSETKITAMLNMCTHSAFPVLYEDQNTPDGKPIYVCKLHNAIFNIKNRGAVIQGPAAVPLREFRATLEGDLITVDTNFSTQFDISLKDPEDPLQKDTDTFEMDNPVYDDRTVIFYRRKKDDIFTYEGKCTHDNHKLEKTSKAHIYRCKKDGSEFDISKYGMVVKGPAKKDLPMVHNYRDFDILTVNTKKYV